MKKTNLEYIVYKATSPSGRIYIGITGESLNTRIHKHFYQAKRTKTKFAKCILKYGKNITWQIIKTNLSQKLAIKYEIYYIKKYNTYKDGYNSTLGGEGAFGYKWDKDIHKIHHNKRVDKFYKDNVEFKKKQSCILKNFYKENPDRREKNIKTLNDWRKNNLKKEHEDYRLFKLREFKSRLKNSMGNGSKPFNVYDFIKREYVGSWVIKADCSKYLNLCNGKISACLNNKRNFHKQYIFKLADDITVDGIKFNELWLLTIRRGSIVSKTK